MSLIRHIQIDYANYHNDRYFGHFEIYQADRFKQNMTGYTNFNIRFIKDDYCSIVFANGVKERCKYFMNMRGRVYNMMGYK